MLDLLQLDHYISISLEFFSQGKLRGHTVHFPQYFEGKDLVSVFVFGICKSSQPDTSKCP